MATTIETKEIINKKNADNGSTAKEISKYEDIDHNCIFIVSPDNKTMMAVLSPNPEPIKAQTWAIQFDTFIFFIKKRLPIIPKIKKMNILKNKVVPHSKSILTPPTTSRLLILTYT